MFLRPSAETSHRCQLLSWLPPAVRKTFDLLLCSSFVVFVVFFVVGYILSSGADLSETTTLVQLGMKSAISMSYINILQHEKDYPHIIRMRDHRQEILTQIRRYYQLKHNNQDNL